MMRWQRLAEWSLWVPVLLYLLLALPVWAQAPPKEVDLSKAKFVWVWEKGTGSDVTYWWIRCGRVSKMYDIAIDLHEPTSRSMPLSRLITAPGDYYCVMSAVGEGGTSLPTPELFFRAQQMPNAPTGFDVSAE